MLGGVNGIRAREGAGAGINLVPAVTSPFMWSVNSNRVEDGVTMSGDEAELDGVLAGEHVEEGKGELLFVDDYYVMPVHHYYYYYWAMLSGHRYVPTTENDNNRPSVLF